MPDPGQKTYALPLDSEVHQVRFLIRDNADGAMVLFDEEIQFHLTHEANVWMAAAACCEQLADVKASSKSVGDLSISYSPAEWRNRAATLRKRGQAQYMVPSAGGTTKADVAAFWNDAAMPARRFSVGQFDHPDGRSGSLIGRDS